MAFAVPADKVNINSKKPLPCPFTAQGILQPSHLQPPPMFGPRGPTIPPKHLPIYKPRYQHPKFQGNRFGNSSNPHPGTYRPRHQVNNNPNRNWNQRPPINRIREFWCETCDRDFNSDELLAEHKQQHQKCGIDGCKFEGHELMVTKHIQMQHSSGLYEKIKNLNTPEDIAKWRAERRKRYPTKQNVEMRQQMQEAKQKRGERLDEPKNRFGRKCDRKQPPQENTSAKIDGKKRRRKRKVNRGAGSNGAVKEKEITIIDDDDSPDVAAIFNGKLPQFQGTSKMVDYKKPQTVQVNALSSLLGMYGSDEEDSNDSAEIESNETVKPRALSLADSVSEIDSEEVVLSNKCSSPVCDESTCASSAGREVFEEQPLPLPTTFTEITAQSDGSDIDNEPPDEQTVKRNTDDLPRQMLPESKDKVDENLNKSRKRQEVGQSKASQIPLKKLKKTTILDLSKRYRNQNTMLEKLLQKDIRHERNVLLQCVRHVVRNKFFGIGQMKPDAV